MLIDLPLEDSTFWRSAVARQAALFRHVGKLLEVEGRAIIFKLPRRR
jgi:hypothetical protein